MFRLIMLHLRKTPRFLQKPLHVRLLAGVVEYLKAKSEDSEFGLGQEKLLKATFRRFLDEQALHEVQEPRD